MFILLGYLVFVNKFIESLKQQQISKEINQRAKTDKISKSKDIIIMAKDKRIKELENENKRLKEQFRSIEGQDILFAIVNSGKI